MEKLIIKYYKTFICFIFMLIVLLPLIYTNSDYVRYKYISTASLDSLECVEGEITKIKQHKSSYDIYIGDLKLFSNIKHDIELGDKVVIYYYADTLRDHNDIVEIRKEEDIIYSIENYIEKNNYMVYFYVNISLASIGIILLILGLILIKFPANVDTLAVIKKYAKKYNLSDEQIEEAKAQLIPYYKRVEINKASLIDKFRKSFYIKNDRYYTSAMEYVESNECGSILNEVIYEIIDNGELRLIYDDCLLDDSACFFVYKYNNKLVSIYMFDEDDGKFLIDDTCCYFIYPKEMKMNITEKNLFYQKLKEYSKYSDEIIIKVSNKH